MDAQALHLAKEALIQKSGPWTDHNMHLGSGVYTISDKITYSQIKLRRITQIISDLANAPLKQLRILDLACLEGLYGLELARHGAHVIAIEGRPEGIEKGRFVQNMLSLDTISFVQDDIRNLSREKYGEFDIVLCLGVLYHLNEPALFQFLENLAGVCKRIAIFDTYISLKPRICCGYKGRRYWGLRHHEHSPESTAEQRRKALWASLDNAESFWFTRPSLYNVLAHVGFTSLHECQFPTEIEKPQDRLTLVALKGARPALFSAPLLENTTVEDLPEVQKMVIHECQRWYAPLLRKLIDFIPWSIRKTIYSLLRGK